MNNKTEVDINICLALYNGQPYLPELLSSLEEQTEKKFKIIARDDLSRDRTVEILEDFKKSSRHDILIISDDKGRLGAEENFLEVLKYASGDLILFCDQDDIWVRDKVRKFKKYYIEEGLKGTPAVIYSDYIVFDDFGQINEEVILKKSLWDLKYENYIPGCCMGITSSIVKKINELKYTGLMHDWASVIVNFVEGGRFIRISDFLTMHRQHDYNTIGYYAKYKINFNVINFVHNLVKVKKGLHMLGVRNLNFFYLCYTFMKLKKVFCLILCRVVNFIKILYNNIFG